MKIGDDVAIKIGIREFAFGKLLAIVGDQASVLVDGFRYTRQLKRIKTSQSACAEIKRRKAEKKRYRV